MMNLYKPEVFHGENKKGPFFEGWYHKISSKDGNSMVLIPGIYKSGKVNYENAFLMIYNGYTNSYNYLTFDTNEFKCSSNKYELNLGDNYFSKEKLSLNISKSSNHISGEIFFGKLRPWPVSIFEPGCMGWYAYVPTMECFHGILSMNHEINGQIKIDGKNYDFDNGKGYIEKDWGKNFPQNWIWAQSNHFKNSDLSVSISLATIPWRKKQFTGYIVGVQCGEKLYRFAPYNNSKTSKIKFKDSTFIWHLVNKNIEVKFKLLKGKSCSRLHAPDEINMVPKVNEYLDGTLSIELYENGELIIKDDSEKTAVEMIGDLEYLIKNV